MYVYHSTIYDTVHLASIAMEAISLQERLQLIQQQQMERFKTRRSLRVKIKEDNAYPDNNIIVHINQRDGEAVAANQSSSLCGVDPDTDLELKTASQEDRTKILTSKMDLSVSTANHSKEIEYLKSCIEQLQSDNAKLKSEIKQKERKIAVLEKEREEGRVAMGTVGATATQRIVELSKRNRELNAEVAAEKNRVRELQKKLKEAEMNMPEKGSQRDSSQLTRYKDIHKCKVDVLSKPQEDEATVIAQLQEQLQQSKLKMAEQRNQCQLLKQELKLAQRVITKEVGDGANISALLSGGNGWRGRAQQIITLQSKLAELGEQLRQGSQNGSTHVRRVTSSEYCDHTVIAPMAHARQKAALRKIESDKQTNLDKARSELKSLKADYSKVQQQCSALKARNKTLTSNVKSLKEEITSLTEKHTHKDKAKLMGAQRPKSLNSDNFDVLQDIEREKQLLSKDNQILQTQLEKCLTELQTLKTSMNNPSPLPSVASRGRQRGQTERKAVSAGQPLGSLCMHSDSDASLMAQVSQIERERLLELTRCLQQRLDATTDKFNDLDIEMRTLRQRNARLEKSVGRSRVTTASGTCSDGSKETKDQGKVDELETQLAIQMDVNAVLKDTLDLTRQEKMEDLKLYQRMLQETKKLLLMDTINLTRPIGNN